MSKKHEGDSFYWRGLKEALVEMTGVEMPESGDVADWKSNWEESKRAAAGDQEHQAAGVGP